MNELMKNNDVIETDVFVLTFIVSRRIFLSDVIFFGDSISMFINLDWSDKEGILITRIMGQF